MFYFLSWKISIYFYLTTERQKKNKKTTSKTKPGVQTKASENKANNANRNGMLAVNWLQHLSKNW